MTKNTATIALPDLHDLDAEALRSLARDLPRQLRDMADDLDRRTLTTETAVARIAGNVRAALASYKLSGSLRPSAKPLVSVLEVSDNRARDLYHGRKPFTHEELSLLSAYFDCDVLDWMPEKGPSTTWPLDLAVAEDRLVTARETAALM